MAYQNCSPSPGHMPGKDLACSQTCLSSETTRWAQAHTDQLCVDQAHQQAPAQGGRSPAQGAGPKHPVWGGCPTWWASLANQGAIASTQKPNSCCGAIRLSKCLWHYAPQNVHSATGKACQPPRALVPCHQGSLESLGCNSARTRRGHLPDGGWSTPRASSINSCLCYSHVTSHDGHNSEQGSECSYGRLCG